jgi:hypothetical protein
MVLMEPTMMRGAPSWRIHSDCVEAWITVRGAQIAPVEFRTDGQVALPYSLAPWEPGTIPGLAPLLDALRGDFFCLPFGQQPSGPPHGEPASADWTAVSITDTSLALHMDTTDSGASIDKIVSVREGQTALYQELRIVGLDGDFPYGTHPILDFSADASGAARISTSPMRWLSTNAGVFSDPAAGETQVLSQNARFEALDRIPCADGSSLDLTTYPTLPGHEDLVMLVNDAAAGRIGWSAASFDGFVWFSLKDVLCYPATLLWISNGGRTQLPWQSRHTARMGIEDVCSYFADGLEASRANPLIDQGIPTVRHFEADRPVRMRTIHGVAFTPAGFGRVAEISTQVPGRATITDEAGRSVVVAVDWSYVLDEDHHD